MAISGIAWTRWVDVKHRQAEGGFRCETYRFAPGVIQVLATTNPVAFRGRECDNDGPVAAEAACEDSQGERPSGFGGSGLAEQAPRSRCRELASPNNRELRRY